MPVLVPFQCSSFIRPISAVKEGSLIWDCSPRTRTCIWSAALPGHHEKKQTFKHYAVLSQHPLVMIDGLLGALPYLVLASAFWSLSPVCMVAALLFEEFHVVWRHTTKIGWQTPKWAIAFGDIFSFLDGPARQWLRWLLSVKKGKKRAA